MQATRTGLPGPRQRCDTGASNACHPPLRAAGSSPAQPSSLVNPATCREVVQTLAQTLRAEYVLPETADTMARALEARVDGRCTAPLSVRDLSSGLTTELRAISRDKHLGVFHVEEPPPFPQPLGVGGVLKSEILEGNIGYIETTAVPPLAESRAQIDAAFTTVRDTAALILDVRANGGGDPNTVAFYVSYLSEGPPVLVNSFYWRTDSRVDEFFTTDLGERSYGSKKPVYVLTSAQTFSGGEELAYDLQAAKRAVLVGETTGGGANPGGSRELGHGFIAGVPSGRAINPITQTNWEGTGVKPEIAVPADQALATAHRALLARLAEKPGIRDPG